MTLIYSLITILSTIFLIPISLLSFALLDGFFAQGVLNRLAKASFKFDGANIFLLWICYCVSMMAFAVLVYYIPYMPDRTPENFPTKYGIDTYSVSVALIGLTFLYFGRIITKFRGVHYGRTHFAILYVAVILILVFNAIIDIVTNPGRLAERFEQYFIDNQTILLMSFIGSFCLAFLGELTLSLIKGSARNLRCFSEKFPTDFRTITGLQEKGLSALSSELWNSNDGLIDKIEKNFREGRPKSFKCVTKNLWILKHIDIILKNSNIDLDKSKCKILMDSSAHAIKNYKKSIIARPPSLDFFIVGRRDKKISDFIAEYRERQNLLKYYNVREHDLASITFLITYYEGGNKDLMFIVNDVVNGGKLIGLYTKDLHYISIFSNIFDAAWIDSEAKIEEAKKVEFPHQHPTWYKAFNITIDNQ